MSAKRIIQLTLMLALASPLVFAQYQHTSQYAKAEIQDHLYHANVFKHGKVEVAFKDGVATLTGTVDSVGVRMDADKAARKVEDVTKVINDLTVYAPDVTPLQIVEQARKDILTYYAYTIFDWVTLEVQGRTLIVNGYVTQPWKKTDIGWYLSHIKGVADLQNNLEVLPVSFFDSHIRLAIARAIYNDPMFITYASMANPPIHIVVKNGNVTLDGIVNNPVEKAKASEDARFAATYFSLTNNLQTEVK